MRSQDTIFTFRGDLDSASFREFARHRAERLSLTLDLQSCDDSACRVVVGGPPALVDAFEMACSLGPYDCLIADIERQDHG